MIETAVAIIATCLPRTSPHLQITFPASNTNIHPALRTLLLGHMSSAGTGSNYGRYELSSAGANRSRRTQHSRITTNVVGGASNRDNDSQDELVKEAGRPLGGIEKARITVNTTIQMHHVQDQGRQSQVDPGDFA